MKSVIDRYRELAGIVEARPAYLIALDEQTEEDLRGEIDDLIAECKQLETQLEARGLLEQHYLAKHQAPELDVKSSREASLQRSRGAKSHTIHKKLSGLKRPKRPSDQFLATHQHGNPTGVLQRGDTHEKGVSSDARGDRKRRMHAQAAFHHFHTAQLHKALGNEKKAVRHIAAAEAHHKRAKVPEGVDGGSYMFDVKTGKHTDYTPVYDKKGEKTRKNALSRKARQLKLWKSKTSEEPKASEAPPASRALNKLFRVAEPETA